MVGAARRGVFLLVFTTLLMAVLVAAAPPFEAVSSVNGLQLQVPTNNLHSIDNTFKVHVHVYNTSGYNVSNLTTSCYIHFYNHTNSHVAKATMTYDGNEFEYSSFAPNYTGEYQFTVWCVQPSTGYGGFYTQSFRVTTFGQDDDKSDLTPVAVIILLPFIVAALFLAAAFFWKDDEEHKAYRWGLYAFSVFFIFAGFGYALFALQYHYAAYQFAEELTFAQLAYVSFCIFIVAYWCVYLIVKAIDWARKKRNGGE